MDDPKPQPAKEYHEGPESARRFEDAVRKVMTVPREEYEKRHTAWEKARKNQRKKARV